VARFLLVRLFVPETTGKSLQELDNVLGVLTRAQAAAALL
jgi:hypothetical protein